MAHQSMRPEDNDSFNTGNRLEKAAKVNPFQVSGHHPPITYTNSPIKINHVDAIIAIIAPGIPKLSLLTKIHDSTR